MTPYQRKFSTLAFFLLILLAGCVPKEQVVLKSVSIREVVPGPGGNPLLKADAIFYNPNATRMRLKHIDIDVTVDGKKAARVDQQLNSLIKGNAEFTVPLEVQLNLKEIGLLDAIFSFLGGKKYDVQFTGSIKLRVNGFPLRVPVKHREEVKL